MVSNGRTTVLFISRRGTVRSVLASACLQHLDPERFRCLAVGDPDTVGREVHPLALETLQRAHIAAPASRPANWNTLCRLGSPRLDLVITLDRATAAELPAWPGRPEQALWEYADLLDEQELPRDPQQFMNVLLSLRRRLELLVQITRRQASRADFSSDLREMAYMR